MPYIIKLRSLTRRDNVILRIFTRYYISNYNLFAKVTSYSIFI